VIAAALLLCGAFLVRGALEPWVQHIPSGPAIAALFRGVPMPGGTVPILLPPRETRPALTTLLAGAPRDAMLYRLRAREAEVALDFAAAEADWRSYSRNASDRYGAQIELADFFHRRGRPRDELATLREAASAPDDPTQPAARQRGWRAFERMAAVAEREALPEAAAEPVFRGWVARYPKDPAAWSKLIGHLAANHRFAAAETEIAGYGRAFQDELEPVRMRASLRVSRGSAAAAIAVYDTAFQPLWPEEMTAGYFKLLQEQGQLRDFSGRAHTALAANPADLNATARLFHYYRFQNNPAAARRTLLEFRSARESGREAWTADELQTLAQLFERAPDVNEAARLYYALYNVPPAGGAHTEQALYGLANLLLTAPDQPIQFGSGDLSFYRDIATIDASPGFLNGILSLLLNWTEPGWEYQKQNQKSAAYFHRAAGSRLVSLLEKRFPRSAHLAPLRAELVSAYAAYGDDATAIRAGREYLAAFPAGEERVSVAMQVADALARANRNDEEFALYDQLLRELAATAKGVPIGWNPQAEAQPPQPDAPQDEQPGTEFGRPRTNANLSGARSGEYVQVLDKYLSRLASLHRTLDALRVYRTEIDRNPNDAGLYQRLGEFVEQNGMSRDVEEVYAKAIAKFADRSWYHKLARWYLRRKEYGALEKISRDAIAVFSGADLERYFGEIVNATHPDAALYRQLNRYAHERFPEDLVFVNNLIGAYERRETQDDAAAESLLRQYWFYDSGLSTRLFRRLSAQGRLYPEMAEIRAGNPGIANGQFDQAVAANPAAVQFAAEAEAWLSHFEAAAPAARALATAYPGRRDFTTRASSLHRSLAAFYPGDTEIAVTLAGYEQQADPRDPGILARMGDIYADRELFGRARVFWERMPATQPGKPEAYLDTAAVYWDYYRYDDALRWIAAARQKFGDAALFAYQAGAIYEGKRDTTGAVREYLAGALHGETSASGRLTALLNRPETRGAIDRATADAVATHATPEAVALRISVLETLDRRQDLAAFLEARVDAETSYSALADLQETARRLGFDPIEERASERMAAVTGDPVDKMRLTLAHARLLESKKEIAAAASAVDALYRGHPLILGVVRAAVDFHVRNGQPAPAVDILLEASKHARADLAAQFTLEAARVETAAGQTERARALLAGLLEAEPLRTEYLAAMADTYLQAKDDRGFRDFELPIIQRLKQSQLTPTERLERVATIRRGLIPALERLQDAAGAVDQYIEVVDSYPEDEALAREAAAYAVAHNQAARMLAFYRKTVAGAPLDYRWPIVLGRMETVTEDYAAAIADYERAIKARPDRADVFEAKARLEERLMRFDDAIRSYSRLYELAYHDPQYLIKVAGLQARSGRNAEAVAALKTAIIGTRRETAKADFAIAEQLESWHILPDAVTFVERGASLAGGALFSLNDYSGPGHAMTYARIMARARRMDAVLPRLGGNPWADRQAEQPAGAIISETYTPEEKAAFERLLTAQAARAGSGAGLLNIAPFAGLAEVEARWRLAAMAAQSEGVDGRFVALESERGLYGDLGRQLEAYAAANPGKPVEAPALDRAAQAYIAQGDIDGEMRVMRKALARNSLVGPLLDRYLELLASRSPEELLAVIRGNSSDDVRNRAVQHAIGSGRSILTYSAVQTRGRALPPVWTRAYTALAGHYLGDRSPAVDAAFQAALDTRTIGERLRNPLKPDSVIVGAVWFYYGARYGDYLAAGQNAAADAWLPAPLEAAPGDPGAYMAVGDSYAEAGAGAKAIVQYEKALQLDADRGDAYDRMARVLWSEERRPEAISRWKSALAAFQRIQSRGGTLPEAFWGRVAETFTDIGKRQALLPLRNDMARLLRDYYRRNGQYRLLDLIQPAARASIASRQDVGWLAEQGPSADPPDTVIEALMQTPGLTDAQRTSLQRDLVALLARRAETHFGDVRTNAVAQAAAARLRLIEMLLTAGDVKAASEEWRLVPADAAGRCAVEIRLAARESSLDALLERYRTEAQPAPSAEDLRKAWEGLRREHRETEARAVLEFLFEREIHNGQLVAANFLGLAEVKLERNDAPAALALLNRMALVAEDGFDTLLPAAELLGKFGKTAEAADFLRRRVRAVPWDADARLQLARAVPAERDRWAASVVADTQAAYKLRAEAARLTASGAASGSELALLSASPVQPDAAAKPFQVEARIDAARAASAPDIKLRLWMEALAIDPTDERVRTGAIFAAVAQRSDHLALALDETGSQLRSGSGGYRLPDDVLPSPQPQRTDAEKATIEEALSQAADRIGDLAAAQAHLRTAFDLRPPERRDALKPMLDAFAAEQNRRATNTARQPAVKNAIEQTQVVRPRILILRSAQ
jgi:Flp pilus assembly protein TadD